MPEPLADHLGKNLKQLREARGFSQQQIAKLAGVPRATWSHLESGEGNPTLSVLHRVALALQVPIEELVSTPRAEAQLFPRGALPTRQRGAVAVRKLLPDTIPGMEIDRMEFPPGARLVGIPHTPGTREYFTIESGEVSLVAGGQSWTVGPGDVLAFRGDQKHSYVNTGARTAVAYSVVVLAKLG